MGYVEGSQNNLQYALFAVLLTATFEYSSRILQVSHQSHFNKTSIAIKIGLQKLLYSKLFKISAATNKKYSKGDLNNLINSDPEKIFWFMCSFTHFVSIPLVVTVHCIILYSFIGIVFVYAFLLMLATTIIFFYLFKISESVWEKVMANNDARSRILTEIIENIKVIKMNSWGD